MNEQYDLQFSKRNLIISILAITILVIISGFAYFRHEENTIRHEKSEDLNAIARLKINQILQWRKERAAEARFFSQNENVRKFAFQLRNHFNETEAKDYFQSRFGSFIQNHGYENIFVVSDKQEVLFTINPEFDSIDSRTRAVLEPATQHHDIYFSDFYFCPTHQHIHLDVVAPLKNENNRIYSQIVFRIDPQLYLFPLIENWPTSSETSETLILREENDSIRFLNNLRHVDNPKMGLHLPLSDKRIPAVQALLGYEGIFEGIDYRGVKVLSSIHKVPGTPWYMIAKVDKKEIFRELYYKAIVIIAFIFVLILLVSFALTWFYHYRQRNIFKQLYNKEKELWTSEESFRTTLYSIGDAVITTDTDGIVRRVNPVAEQATGWKESEAAGRPLEEVFHIVNEKTGEKAENPVERVLAGGMIVGLANHTMLIRKQGDAIPIADSGAPIRDEDGNVSGVVLVFRDQTEERRIQNRIVENQAKLNRAQRIARLGSWEMHPDMSQNNWSEEMFGLTGFSPENGIPSMKTFLQHVKETNKEIVLNAIKTAKNQKRTVHFEFEFRKPDNDLRYFKATIEPDILPQSDKLIGTMHDITDLRKAIVDKESALEALTKSEENYRNLFQNAQVGIFRTSLEDGKPLEINKTYARLAGYESIQECKEKFIASEHYVDPIRRQNMVEILLEKGDIKNYESQIRRDDGTTFWIIFSARLNREKRYIEGALVDITDRKKAEHDLILAKERAEESDRLKSAFLANLNHEIRTPMNAIVGFTDLLKEDLPRQSMKKYIDTINLNADQLLKIIDDVLTVSRLESEKIPVEIQEFSIKELFESLRETFLTTMKNANITLRYSLPREHFSDKIKADRNKIAQVLNGLISNAVKYTESGIVEFGCRPGKNDFIEFFVSDTGPGISLAEKSRVFERFYRGKKAMQSAIRGTGLGLSIARGLVELMGGRIQLDSNPGEGTTFYFEIPVKKVQSIPDKIIAKQNIPYSLHHVNVLIAEDEITNYQYLEVLLRPLVNLIGHAADGREAITLMEENKYNLVLMDIKMPVMDGLEATRKIKEKHPDVPIIAQTAYTQPEEKAKALKAGCDAYLSKPIRRNDLLEQIRLFFAEKN